MRNVWVEGRLAGRMLLPSPGGATFRPESETVFNTFGLRPSGAIRLRFEMDDRGGVKSLALSAAGTEVVASRAE